MSWYKRANDDYDYAYQDRDDFDPEYHEYDHDFKEFNIHSSKYPDVVESMISRIKNKNFTDIDYDEFRMFNFYHPIEARNLVIEATKEAIEKDRQYGIINSYFGIDYPDEIKKLISNFFATHGRFPFFMDYYATIKFREKHLKEFKNFDLNEIKKWIAEHHYHTNITKELVSFWYYMWLGSGSMPGDVTKYLSVHFNPDTSYTVLPSKVQNKFDAATSSVGHSITYGRGLTDSYDDLAYKEYQDQIMSSLVYYAFVNDNKYVKERVIKRLYNEEGDRVRQEILTSEDTMFFRQSYPPSAVISKRLRSYINNLIDSGEAPSELLAFNLVQYYPSLKFIGITKEQTDKLNEINSLKKIISQNKFDKITSYRLMIKAVIDNYRNKKNNR